MSEVIVLDTHIWLWLIHGKTHLLSAQWRDRIEAAAVVGVSPVSCYEVALAAKRGRITLSKPLAEWFAVALAPAGIQFFPMDERVATQAVELTPTHKDPFDRIIIATALVYQAKLASVDSLFSQYPELAGSLMQP
ncbi:MAG: type II toxin-antitoxin system VapC family toxin [Synechococcaceae cyanobacterium SM2_3_2]|nr:type II toxin-antitoxin system VapC family toxin [Synechococcaceae cyanobacterium SM2_3_2]